MEPLKLTHCTVDLVQGIVQIDDETVRLTTKERELLHYLVDRSGQVVPREDLLTDVWGYAVTSVTRAIDKTVARLRAKIRDQGRQSIHLHTVHGTGYRFEPLRTTILGPRRGNVTPFPTRFVGREEELETITAALEDNSLVSLIGPAGVGKTRLAVDLSRDFRESWFVSLCDGPDIADRLAGLLGLPASPDPSALAEALAARGRCVIIADAAEGSMDALATLLDAVRSRAPEVRWLVTSRTALRLAGEHLIEIGPLHEDDAIALFADRARARRADFAFSDPDEARTLVRALDGLPLAIELAAARVRVLTPTALLDALHHRFEVLTSDRPGRHATLRGAIDISWDLLSPDDQHALARCSVFRGGFDLASAEAILGSGALDRIERLQDHSLLYTDASLRFFLYQSIRDYAAEQLSPSDPVHARHTTHYIALGERLVAELGGPNEVVSLRTLRREIDNLMAVGPALEDRARAALAAFPALYSARPQAALEWLDAVQGVGGTLGLRIRLARAELLHTLGSNDAAIAALEPVLADSETHRAEALRVLGDIHHRRGDRAAAEQAYRDGVALARADGAPLLTSLFLSRIGALLHTSGEPERAHEVYQEALSMHQEQGNRAQEARILANLGILWVAHGGGQTGTGHAQAEAWFEGALAWAIESGDRVLEGRQLGNLAGLYADWERHEDAEAMAEQAIALLSSLGQRRSLGLVHGTLGRLLHLMARYPEADAAYRAALSCARGSGDAVHEGLVSAHLGALCADRGQLEVAADYLDRADLLLADRDPDTLRIAAAVSRGNLEHARGEDGFRRLERSEQETRSAHVRWAVRLLHRLQSG